MAVERLLGSIGLLIERSESVDHHIPEDSALLGLAHDLAPQVSALLRDGEAMLEWVARSPELQKQRVAATSSELTLQEIGGMISAEIAAQEISDLAYFARHEVKGCLNEVQVASNRKNLALLASACEKGLWRLRRALVSVESAIAEYSGQEPPRRLMTDLDLSLQVRQLYAYLHREIVVTSKDDRELPDRLRSLVHRLVDLRELKVYSLLRFDDRVQLRRLLQRILEWLHAEDRLPEEGRHIWQDLIAFAELLSHISLREEVVAHDRRLVGQALTYLFPPVGVGPTEIDDEMLDELTPLLGVDEELDELLIQRVGTPVERWRGPLMRVRERLGLELR